MTSDRRMTCSSSTTDSSTSVFQSCSARWVSQIEVTAELFAHELLQQQFTHRFERGVRQQQFHAATAIFHIDPQPRQNGGVGQPADGGEARVNLQPFEPEGNRA